METVKCYKVQIQIYFIQTQPHSKEIYLIEIRPSSKTRVVRTNTMVVATITEQQGNLINLRG